MVILKIFLIHDSGAAELASGTMAGFTLNARKIHLFTSSVTLITLGILLFVFL